MFSRPIAVMVKNKISLYKEWLWPKSFPRNLFLSIANFLSGSVRLFRRMFDIIFDITLKQNEKHINLRK